MKHNDLLQFQPKSKRDLALGQPSVWKNILLIEDNVGDDVLLQEAFDCIGIDHQIDVVTDGERALGAVSNYAQLSDRYR